MAKTDLQSVGSITSSALAELVFRCDAYECPESRVVEIKPQQKAVRLALHALDAYLSEGAGDSYSVSGDRQQASVYAGGEIAFCRDVNALAHEGAQFRLARIALNDIRDRLVDGCPDIRIQHGIAQLQIGGIPVSANKLRLFVGSMYEINGVDPVVAAIEELEGDSKMRDLLSISAWARIGYAIADLFLKNLNDAERLLQDGLASNFRERGYRLGHIYHCHHSQSYPVLLGQNAFIALV